MDVPIVTVAPARTTALRVVTAVRTRSAWVRPVLDAELRRAHLDQRDADLARKLSIGVVQMIGSLDYAIDRFTRSPGSLEPRVRDALRVSAYEILFMRTSDRAAVHQGVDLVRSVTPRAAGLANAVLRRLSEEASSFPWVPTDTIEGQATLTGHPEWLALRLADDLGPREAQALMETDNTTAPLYLAVDLHRSTLSSLEESLAGAGAETSAVDPPGCLLAKAASSALGSDAVRDGRAFVSDAAAQQVAQLALPDEGGRVVEIGAGRGTKTLVLASHALRRDVPLEIDALDIAPTKLEALLARVPSQDVLPVRTHVADVLSTDADLAHLAGADSVLLDAPCSNVGTLRRHPEKRWSLTPEDITGLARGALGMLTAASHLVRAGGFVVYSTCTVLNEENHEVIAAFLESDDGSPFVAESLENDISPGFVDWLNGDGALQTLPSVSGPDGHFAVRLRHGG